MVLIISIQLLLTKLFDINLVNIKNKEDYTKKNFGCEKSVVNKIKKKLFHKFYKGLFKFYKYFIALILTS